MIIRKRFRRISCPKCSRRVSLIASWRCPRCRSTQHRHAFTRCRSCGFFNSAYIAPCCGRFVHK